MNEDPNIEKELFAEALELPADQREGFLKGACRGDEGLRQRVEELLRVHGDATGILATEDNVFTLPSTAPVTEKVGERIGRYKLLQKIGEGGCGVVHMAEQEEPVRRRVALKVIKLGMDTKQVVARFEAERQALALMDHPNIAKVLDAGATETGCPFFVMELVRGIKITDYCDQNNLPTRERLDLFVKVCQAIQHAHQKGIIHRDIKPSNILVTLHDGVPVPKVIDFGIAKATEGRLTDQTLFTAFEQFIGTPAYMSPEQAEMSGLDIDTRTDIYSLGVLLYELLTGKTPFDAKQLAAAGLDEMRRTIREQEPARPSTRLSTMLEGELTTAAKHHQTDALKLIHLLRGDLDWVVMKALEKDRTRRYETANGLARDIERHLNNEPVVARPPSVAYRLQKTVRRNKLAFAAGTTIAVVLIVGIVTSTWQAVRATRAKKDALLAQEKESEQRRAAVEARQNETRERQRAESYAETLRRTLYASHMNIAFQTWQSGDVERTRTLLRSQVPGIGEEDLRGWEWRYLWSRARPQELDDWRSPVGHAVMGLAYSPGGNLVTYGFDRIRWWDAASRRPVAEFPGRYEWGYALAFSKDGRLLLTTHAQERRIRVWDAHAHQFLGMFTNHSLTVASAAFTPNGKAIISTGGMPCSTNSLGELKLWDASTFLEIDNFERVEFPLVCCDVSADGRLVAASGFGPAVQIWDLESRKSIARLTGHDTKSTGGVMASRFSPDGEFLATGDLGGTVRLWNVRTREARIVGSHGGPITCVAFSADGRRLASTSFDHTAKLWDVGNQREPATLRGHATRVWRAAFAPDGKTLATAAGDGTVKFWNANLPSDDNIFAHNNGEGPVGYSADGRFLAWKDSGLEAITIWDLANTNVTHQIKGQDFTFASIGHGLLVTSPAKTLQWWKLDPPTELAGPRAWAEAAGWTSTAFSLRGDRLAAVDAAGGIHLWQVEGWLALPGIDAKASWIRFALDGETLLVFGPANEIALWNLATAQRIGMFRGHAANVRTAKVSPDGRLLATGSDTTVRLWDIATQRELARFTGGAGDIHSVAFSNDGKIIATGWYEGVIQLWNVASGQQVGTLQGHISFVNSLAFSPDGRTLASSSMDKTLRLWRAPLFDEIDTGQSASK